MVSTPVQLDVHRCRGKPLDADTALELRLRYEAVLEMASAARSQSTVEDLVKLVGNGWRFCANVQRWRLIGDFDADVDGRLTLITFDDREVRIERMTEEELPGPTRSLWKRFHPMRLDRAQAAEKLPCLRPIFDRDDVSDVAVVPLDHRTFNHRYMLFVCSGTRKFNRLDFKFIDAVGSLFVGELSYRSTIQRLTASLEREARHDMLTDLANRRFFYELFDQHLRNAQRNHEPLGVIILDVDHFKKFNDQFGHLAGDDCLKAIGGALRAVSARPLDVAGRLGGEEFGILLPSTDLPGTEKVASRLIEAVDACRIPHIIDGQETFVSVSVGALSIVPGPSCRPADLVKLADDALYEAKRTGRHRYVMCADPPVDCAPEAEPADGEAASGLSLV